VPIWELCFEGVETTKVLAEELNKYCLTKKSQLDGLLYVIDLMHTKHHLRHDGVDDFINAVRLLRESGRGVVYNRDQRLAQVRAEMLKNLQKV
jgi:hypothetical protein